MRPIEVYARLGHSVKRRSRRKFPPLIQKLSAIDSHSQRTQFNRISLGTQSMLKRGFMPSSKTQNELTATFGEVWLLMLYSNIFILLAFCFLFVFVRVVGYVYVHMHLYFLCLFLVLLFFSLFAVFYCFILLSLLSFKLSK